MELNNENLKIKPLQLEDIGDAMNLVLDEGWNQTNKDWELFIDNPQNICLKAEVNDKLVATATAIVYDNQLAWIGMVLVNKAYRGKGLATILMTTLLKMLTSIQSIKLDATPAGQHVYKKIGFAGEYQINRMINPSVDLNLINAYSLDELNTITEQNHQEITEFDAATFGIRRDNLINYLLKDFPQVASVIKQNNKIIGYVSGRQGNKHFQIGPVSANSTEIAKSLITYALKKLGGQSVVIDILADKTELTDWLEKLGFEQRREFIRMYSHSNPFTGKPDMQYLICGPEFG